MAWLSKFTIDGQRIVALDVPEFAEVPTICKADLNAPNNQAVLKRGATYIRTERASSEGVSTADAMRDLMNRAVVKRGDQLLRMVERLIKGKPLELSEDAARQISNEIEIANQFLFENLPEEFHNAGRWEVEFSIIPYQQERIEALAEFSDALRASQVTLRGWYFPHFDRVNVSNHARGTQSFTVPEAVQVVSIAYRRNADVVTVVLDRANGKCEECQSKAPFLRASDGSPIWRFITGFCSLMVARIRWRMLLPMPELSSQAPLWVE